MKNLFTSAFVLLALSPHAFGAAATRQHQAHAHCGWIGADTAAQGTASFAAHPDWFDAIHPKWFTLDANGQPQPIAFTDDATVTKTARDHGVKLIPLIDSDKADYLRAAMANPSAHAQQLADLAVSRGYDGLELDYEHLWSQADRPGYLALIEQAAAALHSRGKLLTLALPAMDHDDGNNAYDYATLQNLADTLHLMAYDFHWLGGPHLGPLAPKGWVEAVVTRVQQLGAPQKYVLGLANYAIGAKDYTSAGEAAWSCNFNYERATDHMNSCSLGHQEAGSAPHCQTPDHGEMWFEDALSVYEKAELAVQHQIGGIGYWTVGNEIQGLLETVSNIYP